MTKFVISTLVACLCTGCVATQSKIQSQGVTLELPKDARFDALIYSRSFVDKDGVTNCVSLFISNAVFRMNPSVIDAKTRHDVELFNAGADLATKLIGALPK